MRRTIPITTRRKRIGTRECRDMIPRSRQSWSAGGASHPRDLHPLGADRADVRRLRERLSQSRQLLTSSNRRSIRREGTWVKDPKAHMVKHRLASVGLLMSSALHRRGGARMSMTWKEATIRSTVLRTRKTQATTVLSRRLSTF